MSSQNRKKQRKVESIESPQKIYIFCEGKETEPNYFESFKKEISKNPIYKNTVTIEVEGLGKETLRVVEYAENYLKDKNIAGAQVWCVYDKDSFPEQDFNNAYYKVADLNKRGLNKFYAAWSNQCIEYWFILHFDYYDSDNDRSQYISYLNEKFKRLGLEKYKKNNAENFNILMQFGNPRQAIARAIKRIKLFESKTPSQSSPATLVYLLVLELSKYLPDLLKGNFVN